MTYTIQQKVSNRRSSRFLTARKKTFLQRRISKIGFNFLTINTGTLQVSKTGMDTYKAVFTSEFTGRKAHAFGASFHDVYQRLIKLFYLKYAS